tara:strand:+ start:290 stop:547 length:258 start_codon:yes stop_codon:yes gene_type:complete
MANKFKIGDKVREQVVAVKRDADGNPIYRRTQYGEIPVETKVWSDHTLEVVAVPDGKKKRYAVRITFPNGHTRTSHYSEKALAAA